MTRFLVYRVSDEEERNIILLRLLEYLGHPNPYICAVAYNEVRNGVFPSSNNSPPCHSEDV